MFTPFLRVPAHSGVPNSHRTTDVSTAKELIGNPNHGQREVGQALREAAIPPEAARHQGHEGLVAG